MPNDASRVLEFDRVLNLLSRRCQFSVAAERALEIGPTADAEDVRFLLSITREAVALANEDPGFSVGGMRDIREVVERAQIGHLLSAVDLRDTLDSLQAAKSLRSSFLRKSEAAYRFSGLAEFVDAIAVLPGLEADLVRTVGPRGEILDSASEQLGEIRRELKSAHRRLLERLNRLIADGGQGSAIQDPIVTMREGRYVIPVRADRRSQIPGVVHATSASGQTLFVEPMFAVELNNRWRELQMAEEHEVERILRQRTNQVGAVADDLARTVEAVAAIDLALAKARFAFDLRASEPVLTGFAGRDGAMRPIIDLQQARHPLLDQATVVPIDIQLGRDYRVLVVTGPNTGGKTVALKTVGLLAMMAQSGLFIPAADGSQLSVFSGIFADIGDEQSIEQSLSTFSGHMTKLIAILRGADEQSLVLIDEIAAGTDPQEGSALARAIIHALLERGTLAIVTTHYSELKAFAYVTEGVENASAEFDLRTLSPTYRLVTGVPGRSNALEIAQRLGLDRAIVGEARGLLDPDAVRADDLLTEIQRRRAAAEAALIEARREREMAASVRERAERDLREAEQIRATARQDALAEVEAELREARTMLRRIEGRAREIPAASAQPEAPQPTSTDLRAAERLVRDATRRRQRPAVPAERLSIGDSVEVPSLGVEGEIVGFADNGDSADIQAGAFKLRQPLVALRKVSRPTSRGQRSRAVVTPPAPRVDQELHLRGMRAAEVEPVLDSYLDSAALASLPWVRIVHGKGSGVLRNVVHEVLRRHPAVERFELAEAPAGGEGVTVVHLKD